MAEFAMRPGSFHLQQHASALPVVRRAVRTLAGADAVEPVRSVPATLTGAWVCVYAPDALRARWATSLELRVPAAFSGCGTHARAACAQSWPRAALSRVAVRGYLQQTLHVHSTVQYIVL
jgi:hypothetical protein